MNLAALQMLLIQLEHANTLREVKVVLEKLIHSHIMAEGRRLDRPEE